MNAFAQVAGWTLIHFLWQGVAIAMVVAAALGAARRRAANVRYAIGCCGLLVMVAAPLATAYLLAPAGQSWPPGASVAETTTPAGPEHSRRDLDSVRTIRSVRLTSRIDVGASQIRSVPSLARAFAVRA